MLLDKENAAQIEDIVIMAQFNTSAPNLKLRETDPLFFNIKIKSQARESKDGSRCRHPPQSSEESERPKKAPRGDAAAEKESAGPTIAPEQLRGEKSKSYEKMLLKTGLTKGGGTEQHAAEHDECPSLPSPSQEAANTNVVSDELWGCWHQ